VVPRVLPAILRRRQIELGGEFTLLFGVLAAFLYGAAIFAQKNDFYWLRWLSAALVALHLIAMAWPKWIAPQDWPGHLPPISLLSVLLATAAVAIFLRRKKEHVP
jgi:hypothetical protein